MKKNNISKIALLISLLINTNAKGFYQCVPKPDWFKKQYNILTLQDKFKTAKTQINNDSAWELVVNNQTNGNLDVGIYKVVIKGGDGGASGMSAYGGMGGWGAFNYSDIKGQYGGILNKSNPGTDGETSKQIFLIRAKVLYTACFGHKGNNGSNGKGGRGGNAGFLKYINDYHGAGGGGGGGSATGGQGGGGAGAYFKIKDLELSVKGGSGGIPPDSLGGIGGDKYKYGKCSIKGEDAESVSGVASSGLGTGGYGCKDGNKGSDGKASKGALGGGMRSYNDWYDCYEEDNKGRKGGDGIAGLGGNGGVLMSSGATSYSGDGYVRIYKYIG